MDKFNIRPLQWDDTYKISEIIEKMNFDAEQYKLEGASDAQVAAIIITAFFKNMHKAKDEINSFLGDLTGKSADEFGTLPIRDVKDVIKHLVEKEDLKSFF